ncbi:MAG: hypothetical protein H5U38_14885 [Calditrichaeota bacterium]|nr:hypothetical protein [Calditrichota bacterium]
MWAKAVAGSVLAVWLVVGAEAGQNSGGRTFASLSLGGASLVKEGGTFAVLQGQFRGPVLNVGTTGIQVEYVGYRAAYDGCLLARGEIGYRLWRRLSVTIGAELDWPRYRITSYSWTSGSYPHPAWGEEPNAPPGLAMSGSNYFFAPSVGLRFYLAANSAGPYFALEWGKVFRHADVQLDRRTYYTGWPYETRVRDRDTKGIMRLGIGNAFPLSSRASIVVCVGLTAVKDSGLFFLDYLSGDQYITLEGKGGVEWGF